MMNYDDIKIIVDGVTLPAPISIDYSLGDIDKDSERDVKEAIMDRNRIRSDTFKLSLTYSMNKPAEVSTVLKAVSPETFSVELFDIKENKRATKTMYAGDKSAQMVLYDNVWVKGLKFNLIEV